MRRDEIAFRGRRLGLSAAALVLTGLVSGCCSLARLETVLAPPQPRPADEAELRRMKEEAPVAVKRAAALSAEIDLSTADRCDVLDPGHCLFPFPNDFFTVASDRTDTGRAVHFARESMPANRDGEHVDPEAWRWSDGFSPGAMVLTRVPGLDLGTTGAPVITGLGRSLDTDSPILIVDAETGERQLFWAELDAQAEDPASRALILRPAANLEQGRRYLVALRRLADGSGAPIPPSRAFAIYRDRIPHGAPEIERRRPHMEDVFTRLAAAGVGRDDLYLAWDFTVASTRSVSERLLAVRDDAFGVLGSRAPRFEVLCKKKSPAGGLLRRVWGSYEVPGYLEGDAGPGSRLRLDDAGLPVRTGTVTAYFSCLVPESARDRPAGLMIYGHGLLNSLDEIGADDVRAMSAEHGYVVCATNWSGLSAPDTLQAVRFLRDASEFPAVADRLHQGILNTLFLGRLMIHADGLASHPAFQDRGRPLIDRSRLVFDGNSQGTVLGGAATAIAQDWTRATLGVSGMNYSLFLNRSADFAGSRFKILGFDLPSFRQILHHSYLDELERPLVLALIQMLWDRAELNGHAGHLVRDPYPGTPVHEVLVHEAFGDQALANVATEVLARTLGIPVHQPALADGRDPRPDPYFGIPAIPSDPFAGSAYVVWDDGSCPTPLDNTAPMKDRDPHGVIRRQPSVQRQKAVFLETGEVVDVCGGEPCRACEVGGRCDDPCTGQ